MNDFIILIKTKININVMKTRKNKNRKLVNQENLPHCFVKYKMKAWFRKYSTWALFFTEVFTLIIVHLLLVSDWVLDQQETFMWFFFDDSKNWTMEFVKQNIRASAPAYLPTNVWTEQHQRADAQSSAIFT